MYDIVSNGSKFAGEQPDNLDKLREMLKTHELEGWSYTQKLANGTLVIAGNFKTYSHVFYIRFSDTGLWGEFRRRMYQNRRQFKAA